MMTTTPTISVLMPAYNAEKYIREAIDSILAQTFTDFEFIIINDGSTDKTEELILQNTDPRIRYYKNDQNLGIVGTLNRGLELCRGKYIARMDADDIALPERFAKQVAHMDANPNLVACGAQYVCFGEKGFAKSPVQNAIAADDVRVDMLHFSQISHPLIMMRASVFRDTSLRYRQEYYGAEDYKLFTEMLAFGDMDNIPEVLLHYRINENGISVTSAERQQRLSQQIKLEYAAEMGVNTRYTLYDSRRSDDAEIIKEVLKAYWPIVKTAGKFSLLRKDYVSLLKRYLRMGSFGSAICGTRQYAAVLTTKDMIAILVKRN